MKKLISIAIVLVAGMLFSGCAYTESAQAMNQQGINGVKYTSDNQKEVAIAGFQYLENANADCGTTTSVENGIPIVKTKPCVATREVFDIVNAIKQYQKERIGDIAEGFGKAINSATNLGSVFLTTHYGYKEHELSMQASIANTASNNQLQGTIFENYTGNFQNTTNASTDKIVDSSNNINVTDVNKIENTDKTTTTTEKEVIDTSKTVDSSNNTTQGD